MVERGLGFFISEQAEIMEGTGYLLTNHWKLRERSRGMSTRWPF